MAAEDQRRAPRRDVPEADRAVGRGHGDPTAVGAIGGVEWAVVEGMLHGRGGAGEATEIERLEVAPGPAVGPLPAAPRRGARGEEPTGRGPGGRQAFPGGEGEPAAGEPPPPGPP